MLAVLALFSIIFLWREHSRWESRRDGSQPVTAWDKLTDEQKLERYMANVKAEIEKRHNKS